MRETPFIKQGNTTQQKGVADFGRKWDWYQSIDTLAGGDVFKHEAVGKLKLSVALLKLSYEADKNRLERELMKPKK